MATDGDFYMAIDSPTGRALCTIRQRLSTARLAHAHLDVARG